MRASERTESYNQLFNARVDFYCHSQVIRIPRAMEPMQLACCSMYHVPCHVPYNARSHHHRVAHPDLSFKNQLGFRIDSTWTTTNKRKGRLTPFLDALPDNQSILREGGMRGVPRYSRFRRSPFASKSGADKKRGREREREAGKQSVVLGSVSSSRHLMETGAVEVMVTVTKSDKREL